jgi:hypothetical protein
MPRWSEVIRLSDGTTAIVCGSGRRPRRQCACGCGTPASIQCDYPTEGGGTCDAFLCRRCAVPVEPDRDHCPHHPRD